MRWFRVYDDAINDPKILKLPEATRWHWIAVLCIASKNDGVLPSTADMAISLRVTPSKVSTIIAALKQAGLLDYEDGKFTPHNWDGRQYKSDVSTERVKRFRKRERNVSSAVSETACSVSVSVSASESVSEKEEKREIAISEPTDFDAFWDEWPNKVGKPAAVKAFKSAVRRGASLWEIQDGLRNYIRDKPPDRPWLNPATFLNQNRWEDRPAPTQTSAAAKPLTEYQRQQNEMKGILDELGNFARGGSGGGEQNPQLLPDHSGRRPEGVRGGAGEAVIDLPGGGYRASG